VLKIPTACSCKTLPASVKNRHYHQKTTKTQQTISLFLDTNRLDFDDTQADPNGFKNFSHHTKKLKFLCLPALAHLVLPDTQAQRFAKPKEPILPTRNQNVEKNLTFFKVNKTYFITFDTIVKKTFSR